MTLAATYEQLQVDYRTFEDFAFQLAQEMGELLRINERRIKTFRVRPTLEAAAEAPGHHPTEGRAANGVVVEFIICSKLCVPGGGPWYGYAATQGERDAISIPVGERDPSQAADQLIEYYYTTNIHDPTGYETNVLYKYSYRLSLIAGTNGMVRPFDGGNEFDAWIDVIKTCGQDPCEPVMTGQVGWIIACLFVGSFALISCLVMTHGRGALAKIRELTG